MPQLFGRAIFFSHSHLSKHPLFLGLRCDHCNFGFKFLQSSNNEGCEPCECNLHGSVSQICHPVSGQCECKRDVRGLRCDRCGEHFYGLDATGCKACKCHVAGSISGTICDAETGQCRCKPNVGGRQCGECVEGYFSRWQNDSFRCLPCHCDKSGTVNGSLLCDKVTGQCPCRSGVTGLLCDQCEPHRYNLTTEGHFQSCAMCECDSLGTLPGTTCDRISGQCVCLPRRQGRRCDRCQAGKTQLIIFRSEISFCYLTTGDAFWFAIPLFLSFQDSSAASLLGLCITQHR